MLTGIYLPICFNIILYLFLFLVKLNQFNFFNFLSNHFLIETSVVAQKYSQTFIFSCDTSIEF
jgi:hypothetical protein